MEATVQHVATKKAYMVPVVAEQGGVEKKTLGLPSGIGETLFGLYINGAV
jgi:hypothetical protein